MGKLNLRNLKIGIVGLGYVGLPLAVEFGKRFVTVGFDIKADRVAELGRGVDSTRECDAQELAEADKLAYTTSLDDLKPCRVFIVTVPTPIDDYKRPDLMPLEKASESVGKVLEEGRRGRVRVHRLPGLHRRGLRPDPGKGLGPQVQQGLFRRVQPRAHQSG